MKSASAPMKLVFVWAFSTTSIMKQMSTIPAWLGMVSQRYEVIKYNDYVELGSEAAVRDAGKLYVEGKDYVVEDGDIMHFRFNV